MAIKQQEEECTHLSTAEKKEEGKTLLMRVYAAKKRSFRDSKTRESHGFAPHRMFVIILSLIFRHMYNVAYSCVFRPSVPFSLHNAGKRRRRRKRILQEVGRRRKEEEEEEEEEGPSLHYSHSGDE